MLSVKKVLTYTDRVKMVSGVRLYVPQRSEGESLDTERAKGRTFCAKRNMFGDIKSEDFSDSVANFHRYSRFQQILCG